MKSAIFTLSLLFVLCCQMVTAQTCPNNPLLNPGFELSQGGWSSFGTVHVVTDKHSGSHAYSLCAPGGDRVYQTFAATPGTGYTFSLWAKATGGGGYGYIYIKFLSSSWSVVGEVFQDINSPTYVLVTRSMTAPANAAYVEIGAIRSPASTGCILLDDACLISGSVSPCSPDVTPPVILNCPANINQFTGNGAPVPTSWIPPNATDNCSGAVTVTGSHTPLQAFPVGVTTVTYTARDGGNNTSTCSFTVTVTNNSSPITFNCPADVTFNTIENPSICSGFAFLSLPTGGSTTCAGGGLTVVFDSYTVVSGAIGIQVFPNAPCGGSGIHVTGAGVAQVNLRISDACGNVKTCTYRVTQNILQTDIVFATCPPNISVTAPAGATGAVVNYTLPTVRRTNCGGVIGVTTLPATTSELVTPQFSSGSTFPIGTSTVVFQAFCGARNVYCQFNVTVVGSTQSNCPGNLMQNSGFESGIGAGWNGSGGVLTTTAKSGAAAAQICNSGNRIYQNIAVTPGKSYTVGVWSRADQGVNATLFLKFLNASWTPLQTNLNVATTGITTYAYNEFSWVAPVGAAWMEVNLTKVSGTGCAYFDDVCVREAATNPCSPDVTPPVLTACPASQLVLILTHGAQPTWTPPTATDNCAGAVTVTGTHIPFQLFPTGVTTVTYTARDAAQNSATCTFTITVQQQNNGCNPDVTPPMITCPANVTATANAAIGTTVTWSGLTTTDNCGPVPSVNGSKNSGDQFPVGVTTVTYTAGDLSGNTAVCSFTVTVTLSGSCANNRITTNPGFELQQGGWQTDGSITVVTDKYAGSHAYSICGPAAGGRVYQTFSATAGGNYTFSLFAKATGGGSGVIFIKYLNSSWSPIAQEFQPFSATTYTQVTKSLIAPTGTTYIEVGALRTSTAGCILLDEACLTGPQALGLQSSNNIHVTPEPFSSVTLYPNPATEEVRLDLSAECLAAQCETATQIDVLSAFGKFQLSAKATQPYFDFNVSDWEPGVYHVRLHREGERARMMKLVVVKI
jgi:hypothetical protein